MIKLVNVNDFVWYAFIYTDCLIASHLKCGTAVGIDNIMAEHILYAHPALVSHLTRLFNLILIHGYVPSTFSSGVIVPLVKDRNGPADELYNYRGNTVSPVISKIFEVCLSDNFCHILSSHRLQLGLKKGSGCSSAIFVVQHVIQYFTKRSSIMFMFHHGMLPKHLIM
jgi:hypothetical protein